MVYTVDDLTVGKALSLSAQFLNHSTISYPLGIYWYFKYIYDELSLASNRVEPFLYFHGLFLSPASILLSPETNT